MNCYCIQYFVGFHLETTFVLAKSPQLAVDGFRTESAAPIKSVYRLVEEVNWE